MMTEKKKYEYLSKSFFVTTPNGLSKQIKIRAKTEKELQEKYIQKKWEYEMGLLVVNKNTTFAHWADEWLNTYKKNKVHEKYYRDLTNLVHSVFTSKIGSLRMGDIRTVHLQNCINDLEGKSASYITKATLAIKSIMKKAIANDIILRDPSLNIEPPKGPKKSRRALTDIEQAIFMEAVKEHKYGPLFAISLACGLRPGEARAATPFNIDKEHQTITITQAVEAGTKQIKSPKTEAGIRTIPLPSWFIPMLNQLPDIKSSYLFPNNSGGLITEQNYQRAWHSFLRQMDIIGGAKTYRNQIIVHSPLIGQDLTPYHLRHTYATKLAEMGVDIKTAQYLLGHSDIKMTANIYTHVSNKMMQDAKKKLGNWTTTGQ